MGVLNREGNIQTYIEKHADYVPEEFGEILKEMILIPEARMWAYCLSQAIANALGNPRVVELARYRERDKFWLFRDRRRHVGSCHWVCEFLGIERKKLLSQVFKYRHYLKANPCRLRIMYRD